MYISTHQALLDFCQRAREFDAIAVDTEFLRERTFHPRLCLVQIATPAESVAVDPLVIDDLSPLAELMADENGNEKRHGFIIIAGSGFDAEIMMKAAPTKNDIGEIAYFLSALATPNPTVAHFTIEHDGIVEELDGICCMAGNTSVIQNDINLFPDCRMNDGMVDIAVIEPVKTVQLLPTVITAALDPAGKVLGRPQFKIIQTKEAKITCTPSLGMQFDGEIISSNSGVFGARTLPQCLDLIVDEFSPLGK